tara:strand:- start:994 stop:1620 length:627 start_codon:yes stop_codon:yes gene_type:complete
LKFRVIQSNNRGLITKVGDKTFHSRSPKYGEEDFELRTLYIWVNKPYRYVARSWTKWTGEKISNDYIYEVTKFRDIIDISGQNKFHQWSSKNLLIELWEKEGQSVQIKNYRCPMPNEVWTEKRYRPSMDTIRRANIIKNSLNKLSNKEKADIQKLYAEKDFLNKKAGFIKFHIDHIIPLSKGGEHTRKNIRIVTAKENMSKGSKLLKI